MTTPTPRPTFSFDDALTLLSDHLLALRSDSDATDSTLDDIQYELDLRLSHDDLAYDDDAPLHDPDFTTFPSSAYRSLDPALADRADAAALADLRTIASHIFNLRP